MKRWTEIWSSFPAAHKKRGYQGLAGYGLLVLVTAAWVAVRADSTLQDWQARTPSATAVIKNIYLTPQITDVPKDTSTISLNDITGSDKGSGQPVVDDGKIYVSIIVSGLGLSTLATERAMDDLPPQVTLAFSPYAENVQTWLRKAVSAHHETLMLLPMETSTYPHDDPGPRALSSRFSDQDNSENLNWLLNQGGGSAGVINLMGSRFLTDEKRVSSAFSILRKNDDMFVETPGIEKSVASAAAGRIGLPYMEANLQIDASATDKDIRAQLDALEQTARKHGYAIGIAQPYPLTFNVIKSWAAGLEARGITLAPLKTIWKNKPHYEEDPSQPPSQSELRQPQP